MESAHTRHVQYAPHRCQKRQCGLTVVEGALTLSILAILLSIAVPSYKSLSMRVQTDAALSELSNSIVLARNEAISRNQFVTLCRVSTTIGGLDAVSASNTVAVVPACTSHTEALENRSFGAQDWARGWLVFVNASNTAAGNPTEIMASSQILQSVDPKPFVKLEFDFAGAAPNGFEGVMRFNPLGQIQLGGSAAKITAQHLDAASYAAASGTTLYAQIRCISRNGRMKNEGGAVC